MCLYNKYKYRLIYKYKYSSFLFIAVIILWYGWHHSCLNHSLVAILICMFVHACGGQRCLPLFFPTPTPLLTDSASLADQQAPGIPPVCICPWAWKLKKHQPTSLLRECWGAALGFLCLQSKHFRNWTISWNTVLAIIFLQKNKVPWSLEERGKMVLLSCPCDIFPNKQNS